MVGLCRVQGQGLSMHLVAQHPRQERPGKELKKEMRELVSGGTAKVKREIMEEEAASFPL